MKNFNYLKKFLKYNGYYKESEDILVQLESNPNYPSLYAIIDTLNLLSIENVAIKIEKEDYLDLPNTFLSVYNSDTGTEIIYTKKLKKGIEIEFSNQYKKTITEEEFIKNWTAIVIVIEEKKTKKENILEDKKYIFGILFFLLASVLVFFANGFFYFSYFVISVLGLLISFFLVREDLGFFDNRISKICTSTEKTDCKSVISSKGAKIFRNFSLSDISIVYFLTYTLFIFISDYKSYFSLFCIFSLLTIPVIIYSIFYQGIILKKWCTLCLGIDLVLFLQFLLGVFYLKKIETISVISFFSFSGVIFIITFFWYKVKRLIELSIENEKNEIIFNKFKRQFNIFKSSLDKEQIINEISLRNLISPVIGNDNAQYTIYVALSASCSYCHKMFKRLLALVNKFPVEFNFKIIFNTNVENFENHTSIVYKTVLNFFLNNEYNKMQQSLEDWHSKELNLEQWKSKWNYDDSLEENVIEIIKSHYIWCEQNNVNHTPCVIIKNRVFPKEYDVEDLHYFIENLSEI